MDAIEETKKIIQAYADALHSLRRWATHTKDNDLLDRADACMQQLQNDLDHMIAKDDASAVKMQACLLDALSLAAEQIGSFQICETMLLHLQNARALVSSEAMLVHTTSGLFSRRRRDASEHSKENFLTLDEVRNHPLHKKVFALANYTQALRTVASVKYLIRLLKTKIQKNNPDQIQQILLQTNKQRDVYFSQLMQALQLSASNKKQGIDNNDAIKRIKNSQECIDRINATISQLEAAFPLSKERQIVFSLLLGEVLELFDIFNENLGNVFVLVSLTSMVDINELFRAIENNSHPREILENFDLSLILSLAKAIEHPTPYPAPISTDIDYPPKPKEEFRW